METIPGKHLTGEAHEGRKSVILWARRELDGLPVILKVLGEEHFRSADVACLRREHEILSELSVPGVIKTYGLARHEGREILVLEDFGGRSLSRVLSSLPPSAQKRLDVGAFLDIAIPVVETVGEIHRHDLVHNDIKPHNVGLHPATGVVQSACGLKADLEKRRRQWRSSGSVLDFALGDSDVPARFQIPQKLYGRHGEIDRLLAAFERSASGAALLMLVAGQAGIGKSAIVHEVHKPIAKRRGFFINGKCDQFRQNIPYEPLILAFKDLMRQLAAGSAGETAAWRAKLLKALGSDGRLLID